MKLCYSISVVAGRHSVRIRPVTLMQLAILFPDHEALKEQVDPQSVKRVKRKKPKEFFFTILSINSGRKQSQATSGRAKWQMQIQTKFNYSKL